jgi:hypothetical protein
MIGDDDAEETRISDISMTTFNQDKQLRRKQFQHGSGAR